MQKIYKPAVVGFVIKDKKVLLGLRKKVSLNMGLNIISGIGGKVGDEEEFKNETSEEALIREFIEEVNIKPKKFEYFGSVKFFWEERNERNLDTKIYIIYDYDGEPKETDVIKPEWFDINNLPKNQMWEDNIGNNKFEGWVPKVLNNEKVNIEITYDIDGKVKEFIYK